MSRPRLYHKPRNLDEKVMASVRLPERMRRELTSEAERNGRSFNSEVNLRLASSLKTKSPRKKLQPAAER